MKFVPADDDSCDNDNTVYIDVKHKLIMRVIAGLSSPFMRWYYTHGGCYKFASFLRDMIRSGEIWTNEDHCVFMIDNTFYDITGKLRVIKYEVNKGGPSKVTLEGHDIPYIPIQYSQGEEVFEQCEDALCERLVGFHAEKCPEKYSIGPEWQPFAVSVTGCTNVKTGAVTYTVNTCCREGEYETETLPFLANLFNIVSEYFQGQVDEKSY